MIRPSIADLKLYQLALTILGRRLLSSPKGIGIPIKVLQKPAVPSFKFPLELRPFHQQNIIQTSSKSFQDMADGPNSPIVRVQGPREDKIYGHEQQLLAQLRDIPKDTQVLRIDEDAPSDIEWSLLGAHFTSVKDLDINTGYNEDLNDEKMPLHWPLERLLISSACGEVVRSPFVLEGKVKHLILLLTSGLRFEGPTSDELSHANKEAIARGDEESQYITVREGTPEERKIEIVSIPELAHAWMKEKYTSQDTVSHPATPIPDHINLETLEILENDAIDTFSRMAIALPHLINNLKTLNIRSTNGCDFHFTTEETFREILPQLTGLQTLVLTVGEVFEDEQFLPLLYKHFPPNLSTLRFRVPVSLSKSEHWKEWVEAFTNPEYLRNLKKLSFVMDLDYQQGKYDRKEIVTAQEEQLRDAKTACNQLCAGAEERGITLEPFYDQWSKTSVLFHQVDDRGNRL